MFGKKPVNAIINFSFLKATTSLWLTQSVSSSPIAPIYELEAKPQHSHQIPSYNRLPSGAVK